MKLFFIKLTLLTVLLVSAFLFLNKLYTNTNSWKDENNMYKFSNIPDNLTLANVGSSHAVFALKYDVVPEFKAFNFALAAQPYFYDYEILNKYINHFAEKAVVLIPVSYFGITRQEDFSPFRKRYYRILDKKSMDYWSLKEYLLYSKFPILSAGIDKTRFLYDISEENMSAFFNHSDFMQEDELYNYCIKKHKGWTSPEFEFGQEGYNYNIQAVSKIIDLCYSHKLVPVLISIPITDILNSIYEQDKDFFFIFEKFGKELCNKYPELLYFDYSRMEEISTNHKLFADGDHLNNAGAEKFTRLIVKDLIAHKLLN